MSVTINRNFVV